MEFGENLKRYRKMKNYSQEELAELLRSLKTHFSRISLLMDVYSTFGAKASKYKNPINDVGVTQVYGLDDPKNLEGEVIRFTGEREMTPDRLIGQLTGMEQTVFRKLYAGKAARKMYRLYEYEAG